MWVQRRKVLAAHRERETTSTSNKKETDKTCENDEERAIYLSPVDYCITYSICSVGFAKLMETRQVKLESDVSLSFEKCQKADVMPLCAQCVYVCA